MMSASSPAVREALRGKQETKYGYGHLVVTDVRGANLTVRFVTDFNSVR